MTIGSSWTTAATLGVAFVALAPLLGASPAITAGAVISGAYFGDKMTPISETTVLVPSMVGGVTTQQHIGAMIWTSGPAVLIAVAIFAILGLTTPPPGTAFDPTRRPGGARRRSSGSRRSTSCRWSLLIVLSLRRAPPFLSIFGCALFAARAGLLHPARRRRRLRRPPGRRSRSRRRSSASTPALANGFVSNTGNATIDALFSRGGMDSMLSTIWLVLGALSFAAIMEDAGFLERLIRPVLARAHDDGRLIASVIATCIGLNIIAGDQYVAIVMPSRIYRLEFARRGIAPRMLSRAVEDSGTVTSPLDPVEQLRRLHGRRPGRRDDRLLAVLLLQPHQPGDLAGVRVQRVPDRAHRAARPRRRGSATDRASPGAHCPMEAPHDRCA